MEHSWLLAMLVGALLLAGCTSGLVAPQAPPSGAEAGAGGAVRPVANTSANAGAGQTEIAPVGLKEAQALDKPMRCTVKSLNPDLPNTTLYVKGMKIRAEGMLGEGNYTEYIIQIMRDGGVYHDGVSFGPLAQDKECDWVALQSDITTPSWPSWRQVRLNISDNGTTTTRTQPGDFSCSPDDFGDEKFQTPGKICMMGQVLSGLCTNNTDEQSRQLFGCP